MPNYDISYLGHISKSIIFPCAEILKPGKGWEILRQIEKAVLRRGPIHGKLGGVAFTCHQLVPLWSAGTRQLMLNIFEVFLLQSC